MVDMNRLTPVIVCNVISIVAIALRFWCKLILKTGIGGDDWWTLITILSTLGAEGALLWGIVNGIRDGQTISDITAELDRSQSPERTEALKTFLKSIFVAVTISFFVVYAIKIAILLLYKRIFSTPKYKLASNVLMGIATAWFISIQVANLVHCLPIEVFWNDHREGTCLNFNLLFLIGGILETIIDAAILILPIIGVFTVQMRLKTKIYASGIFILGGFAIVTNILRIYYTYRPGAEFVYKPIRAQLDAAFAKIHNLYASSTRHLLSGNRRSKDVSSVGYLMDSMRTEAQKSSHFYTTPKTPAEESARDLLHNLQEEETNVTVQKPPRAAATSMYGQMV
ncbi:hypothetical protein DL770_000698 [Monosporascus sp. CRB-9-2]|nr:hypothetical protein DL770_000698 [Monosporascus sp. CRB-9-2]